MKKIVLSSLFLLFMGSVFAQMSDTLLLEQTTELESVEVVQQRVQVANERLRVVSVITSEQIQQLPVSTINDVIENLPGVDVRTRGGNGVQADLSMRGGTFDQVVVLLNGVNITDPQSGHFTLDVPVDVASIKRIEILQGSSVSIFGLNAFSGAINIITTGESSNATTASLSGGDYGLIEAALSCDYDVKNWNIGASGSYYQSSGYVEHTDYKYGNIFFQAHCNDSVSGNWHIQLGGQVKDYAANSFYSLAYPDQYESAKILLGSLSWNKRIGAFGLEANLYNRTRRERYELIHDLTTAPDWYKSHNHHITFVTGFNIKGAWYSKIGKTSVGIEVRDEAIYSNVLGEELQKPKHVIGQADDVNYLYFKNRINVNYFVEQSFYYKAFSAAVGVSGNYNNAFGNNFACAANLGYEYYKNSNVFASITRSLRLPTFTDVYYHSATQIANPDLKPEQSLVAELGINFAYKGFKTHLSGYYRMGTNIIDWIQKPNEVVWYSMNHSRIDAMGGEFEAAYSYGYWLKNVAVNYTFCHVNKQASEYISKYALDYMRHKLSLSITHGIYKGLGASWSLNWQSRAGQYTDREGVVSTYNPVWLFDGKIFYECKYGKIYLECDNIANVKYYDYGGVLQAPIWVKGGVVIKI